MVEDPKVSLLPDVSLLMHEARQRLLMLLDSHPGSKCLVLESTLGGMINRVLSDGDGGGTRALKERGVVHIQELQENINDGPDPSTSSLKSLNHVIYLIRPSIQHTMRVVRYVKGDTTTSSKRNTTSTGSSIASQKHKVYFVPHTSLPCEQVFKDEGMAHRVTIAEYPLCLIPYEQDLLSLEMPGVAEEVATASSRSLSLLESMFGVIPNVKAQGEISKRILTNYMRRRREGMDQGEAISPHLTPDIDSLILLDRAVDWVSPLVTPLTYEGLIHDMIGITNGFIKVEKEVVETESSKVEGGSTNGEDAPTRSLESGGGGMVAVALDSSDELYRLIRAQNIEQLGPFLQAKAMEIREHYNSFRRKRDQSITQIHDFVKQIPGLTQNYKSLNLHINIAGLIKNMTDGTPFRQRWQTERSMLEGESCFDIIEGLFISDASPFEVLRLMCLQSITKGGVPSGRFDTLRREFIHCYGYPWLHTLVCLEKAGLLKRGGMGWVDAGTRTPWATMRRSLRLINESVNVLTQDDIAYVSSGYAPLSVRLVQACVQPGWESLSDSVFKYLPGPTINIKQKSTDPPQLLDEHVKGMNSGSSIMSSSHSAHSVQMQSNNREDKQCLNPEAGLLGKDGKQTMLVFYIGGVSYMEVAALRLLNSRKDFPFHIVVATTCILNGVQIIKQCAPPLENKLQLVEP